MDILNCFGDIEANDATGDEDQELIIVGELTQDLLDRQLETICLVGSFVAGCHQELRFSLQTVESQKATFLRISRVNGTDTFQVTDGGTCLEDLPTLLVLDMFPRATTFQDVKIAFDQAHNLMKRYDQGDCHALSQMICDLLVPGSFPAELDW